MRATIDSLNRMTVLGVLSLAISVLHPLASSADEALTHERPIVGSAHDLPNWFEQGFERRREVRTTLADILETSEIRIKPRNYYLNRSKPNDIDSYAWAQGGSVEHRLGRVDGIFSLTTEWFGSFELVAPEEHDGTLLLEPGPDDISALGVLNPNFKFGRHDISAYRQRYELPYVNGQDNRMVPNTFEGYTLSMRKAENERFQYVIGYIDNIKRRDSDVFVPMSEAAGSTESDRGLVMAGARFFPVKELSLSAINHWVDESLNLGYAEAIHKSTLAEGVENTLSVQYSHQSNGGGDEIRGESFSGWMWGIQNAASWKGIILKAAFTDNDPGTLLRSPFGSYPGYNSVTVEDFNRAGESAWQAAVTYDFKRVGLEGANITVAHIQGNGAVDEATKASLPDKNETDVTIDYKVPEGRLLERLWLRLRAAHIDEEGGGQTEDYRVIVNYDFSLLGGES